MYIICDLGNIVGANDYVCYDALVAFIYWLQEWNIIEVALLFICNFLSTGKYIYNNLCYMIAYMSNNDNLVVTITFCDINVMKITQFFCY